MPEFSFPLVRENQQLLGTATLNYQRQTVQISGRRVDAIIGSLVVKDHADQEIGILHLTPEGIRFSLSRGTYECPIRLITSDTNLLFVVPDVMFKNIMALAFAHTIAKFHMHPETLQIRLREACESFSGFGQTVSIPPSRTQDSSSDRSGWDR